MNNFSFVNISTEEKNFRDLLGNSSFFNNLAEYILLHAIQIKMKCVNEQQSSISL